jgi:ComF family protein
LTALFGQKNATWRQRVRYLAGILVDVVFPPVCASCKSLGGLLCSQCESEIMWVEEPICYSCGRPQITSTNTCSDCHQRPLPLNQIRTATFYLNPIAEVIKQFKYEGYFGLAQPLGELMLAAWPRWQHPIDLAISVPLHAARQRERGYNQSELLARFLARHLDWCVETAALKRIRRTRPQVGLNMTERLANVRGAFVSDSTLVEGKQILLIDDVRTTGSTLVAAAEVLLAAGAQSVSAYCLAEADSTVLSSKDLINE